MGRQSGQFGGGPCLSEVASIMAEVVTRWVTSTTVPARAMHALTGRQVIHRVSNG